MGWTGKQVSTSTRVLVLVSKLWLAPKLPKIAALELGPGSGSCPLNPKKIQGFGVYEYSSTRVPVQYQ